MRVLNKIETTVVGGGLMMAEGGEGVYGGSAAYCPPGYSQGVETTQSWTSNGMSTSGTGSAGMTGPVPSGSGGVTINSGNSSYTYTVNTKCYPDPVTPAPSQPSTVNNTYNNYNYSSSASGAATGSNSSDINLEDDYSYSCQP